MAQVNVANGNSSPANGLVEKAKNMSVNERIKMFERCFRVLKQGLDGFYIGGKPVDKAEAARYMLDCQRSPNAKIYTGGWSKYSGVSAVGKKELIRAIVEHSVPKCLASKTPLVGKKPDITESELMKAIGNGV